MIGKALLKLGGVLLCMGVLAVILARFNFSPDPHPVLVRVPKGAPQSQIIRMLKDSGAIHSPFAFKSISRLSLKRQPFRHGTYLFERNHYFKIVNQLRRGLTHRVKVTIPEGWTIYQIAERLAGQDIVDDPEKFAQTVMKSGLEGMLYPETYYFEPGSDLEDIIGEMKLQFEKKYGEEFSRRAAELKLTDRQVLTLASIIEREARIPSERAAIASVYHNRLRKRKLLEADPTVQYAISEGRFWKEKLTYKDLDVNSPYNTYRKLGLPPGPICNPGIESIKAALYPAETSYLYFVADPDGSGIHHFTETYDRHMQKQRDLRKAYRIKMQQNSSGSKSH